MVRLRAQGAGWHCYGVCHWAQWRPDWLRLQAAGASFSMASRPLGMGGVLAWAEVSLNVGGLWTAACMDRKQWQSRAT